MELPARDDAVAADAVCAAATAAAASAAAPAPDGAVAPFVWKLSWSLRLVLGLTRFSNGRRKQQVGPQDKNVN